MTPRPFLLMLTVLTFGLAALPGAKRVARRLLHRSLCSALRLRSRACPFDHAGRTLVIAPHEDDATLGCGGYILRRRLEALPVDVVYITDGRASHPGHPRLTPDAIAAIRREEAGRAMRVLRLEHSALHFLDAVDGTLAHLDAAAGEALSMRLVEVFRSVQPTEILLPCRRDGSSEHEATFVFVERAIVLSGLTPRLLEYPIWARWNPLRLIGPFLHSRTVWCFRFPGYEEQKHRAISAYVSQTEPTPPWTQAVVPRGFVAFFSSATEFFFEH
jgi:N-acetylglucosamine malate deacetylase 1